MNVKVLRCTICKSPIEDDDWEDGDNADLCGVCNLTYIDALHKESW